jgi:uncharacterized protein
MREDLRNALPTAMRARDKIAVSALRSALAALDNAEAVAGETPTETSSAHVAGAVVGLGAAEVARRELSAADIAAVLEQEIAERLDAADQAVHHGQHEHAERLRAEAQILQPYLADD